MFWRILARLRSGRDRGEQINPRGFGGLVEVHPTSLSVACAFAAFCASALAAQTAACPFDAKTLSFTGSPEEQARCLLRPVRRFAHLGDALDRPVFFCVDCDETHVVLRQGFSAGTEHAD